MIIIPPAYEVCWGVYSFHPPVHMFIHTFFLHIWGIYYKVIVKFHRWVYLSNHSSEIMHTCMLTFHKFWPNGSCPGVVLLAKIWNILTAKLLFLLCLHLLDQLGQTTVIHMTRTIVSWGEGQGDLYFMVEEFFLISWRLFDGRMSCMYMYLG